MKKQKSKKVNSSRWFLLLPICACFLIFGSIIAYAAMVAEDTKVNNFQIGNLETKIEEVFSKPAKAIEPGNSVSKKVKIQNEGTINQFVRVMIFPEITTATAGSSEKRILPSKIGKELLIDIDPEKTTTANWKDGGDGYYYYLKAVAPKEATKLLFSKVEVPGSLDKSYYDDADIVIQVKAESIVSSKEAYRESWLQGTIPSSGALKDIDDLLQVEAD